MRITRHYECGEIKIAINISVWGTWNRIISHSGKEYFKDSNTNHIECDDR